MAVNMVEAKQLLRDIRTYSRAVLREFDPDFTSEICEQMHNRAMAQMRIDLAGRPGDIFMLRHYLMAIAEHEMDGYYG